MVEATSKREKMTLEEKASLMSGGNFWNTKSIERLNIHSFMLTDGPHGLRKQGGKADHLGLNKSLPSTCFPTAATLANSWDRELLKKVGEGLGKEAYINDVTVLLGPGMNIKRNPLCGRNFEYFSEDPYLTGMLAASMVKGIQTQKVSACPKHYAVNSQELNRMSVNEVVDKRALHEIYLEGFRLAIKNGNPQTIMTSYNQVNGTFANEHPYLIKEVLRERFNYKGLLVTDWGGNNDRVEALKVGVHLEMPSTNGMTDKYIVSAVKEGTLDESVLDERVDEYLEFIDKNVTLENNKETLNINKHHELARIAAEESIVLLKNRGTLPLDKGIRISLIGDMAEKPRYQGAGSSLINPTRITSLYDAIKESSYFTSFLYAQGYQRLGKQDDRLVREALEVSKDVDVIVFVAGLDEGKEAEGVDRPHMKLSSNQIDLMHSLKTLNKPMVLVLAGGSPIEMEFEPLFDGIIHGYLPGQAGGQALFNVLVGNVNPSGKLAETYPKNYDMVPSAPYFPGLQATSEHRESLYIGYRYHASKPETIKYPFGYGLSYTSFEYKDLIWDGTTVKVSVKNTGSIKGKEIVQVYIEPKNSKIHRPLRELKGFEKVTLEPDESKTISIELSDYAFMIYSVETDSWVTEEGTYAIQVGKNSMDIELEEVISIKGESLVETQGLRKYKNLDIHNIDDETFTSILGYSIPSKDWNKDEPFHENSMIIQARNRSIFGRFVNFIIDKVYDFYMWREKPIQANNARFVQHLPLRGASRMSNGAVNERQMWGLINMLDRKFFKGLGMFIQGYFKKEI